MPTKVINSPIVFRRPFLRRGINGHLSELHLAAYCRTEILQCAYNALKKGNQSVQTFRTVHPPLRQTQQEINHLKCEIDRSEKAPTETAALLVLSKSLSGCHGTDLPA